MKLVFHFLWEAMLKPVLHFLGCFALVLIFGSILVFTVMYGLAFVLESIGSIWLGPSSTPQTPSSPGAGKALLGLAGIGIATWLFFIVRKVCRFFRATWRRVKTGEKEKKKPDWNDIITTK